MLLLGFCRNPTSKIRRSFFGQVLLTFRLKASRLGLLLVNELINNYPNQTSTELISQSKRWGGIKCLELLFRLSGGVNFSPDI
uniref:Uncharacterized protein n=1 Tax=Octopus bimaculoides TaxID=37653 RepID=A0A0L8GMZ9_OCTBM